jgi:hypothetical protein
MDPGFRRDDERLRVSARPLAASCVDPPATRRSRCVATAHSIAARTPAIIVAVVPAKAGTHFDLRFLSPGK